MPTTITYNRGAVVLLPFPFSDQSSAKIRPAVIVSPHYPSDDLLVVAVTSVGDALRPGEFPIQFWREAGLIHPSFAKRAVASVSGELVRKLLGQLQETDLTKLDAAVRLWFGL
ncbi:MAG: type II toxin-antitoxin system PemK/MazF family toxin [Verrucomicrobia bacterium]|nr:type II toxin-antitoxin system PemK/MazF family toxin [Verrucomicrobiota bacterium]